MKTEFPVHQSEEELQEVVVLRLRHLGYTVYEFAKPGAHRRLGGIVPEAWPDLLIIHQGGDHTYIELKSVNGKRTPKQIARHAELKNLGCYVQTCYTFEQAIEVVAMRQTFLGTIKRIAGA